jgi:UDP-N-acetylmuramate--alanine ligase
MELRERHVHLLGIGGAGVSALAELLIERGALVSGCDVAPTAVTERLLARGARITFEGQSPAHVEGQDVLCHTTRLSAAARTEVAAAQKQGLEVLDRPHLLARVLRQADAIGVAGTHGKTTTTAMLAHLLEVVGEQPSALIGDGASSRIGASCVIVAELDESDRSLPLHHPGTAVVTGVEFDHSDYFTDLDDVRGMFGEFLEGLPRDGLAVLCADDPWLGRQPVPARRRTYGYAANADYRVDEEGVVRRRGETLARLRLRAPGRMTRQDAAAALAVAVERGIDPERAAEALATFPGARRRLERLGEWHGAELFDDYGHLPAQVTATVQALRELPHARVLLVFQPHRYSRFGDIEDALVGPLRSADRTLLTEIYAAGEENPNAVSARALAARTGLDFAPDLEAVQRWLEREARPGDVVLLMGAGNVGRVGHALAHAC